MDASPSPSVIPLQTASPERVNQRRDGSVHDKISQFNNLSVAMQSRQLERKTADAALKRAMMGREEAETEMRRLRDENLRLQAAIEEGKERERRVGERLESVMESYGRTKETYSHTQTLWEKEIRRARKENFKTQSTIVKLQEELKTARCAVNILEQTVEREKERTRTRENEAFTARYNMVGIQEKLDEALERIKVVEQERDAFKTAAKNEEVARMAAEGHLPLPEADDEFSSPRKMGAGAACRIASDCSRVSLSAVELVSSAASEMEIEELTTQVAWERQRADRASEMVEFLQAECKMHCCPCHRPEPNAGPPQKRRRATMEMITPGGDNPVTAAEEAAASSSPRQPVEAHVVKSRKETRRSTIFLPQEGIFRTVSEQEAKEVEAARAATAATASGEPQHRVMYARTPSAEPPAFAMAGEQHRTSLQSLLNAPHSIGSGGVFVDDAAPPETESIIQSVTQHSTTQSITQPLTQPLTQHSTQHPTQHSTQPTTQHLTQHSIQHSTQHSTQPTTQHPTQPITTPEDATRPHTSATLYTITTTIPLRDTQRDSSTKLLRTPSSSSSSGTSFDFSNPALTPTMTREQALAKIRERRGRVRSAAATAAAAAAGSTPAKPGRGLGRREVSAPTVGSVRRR